MKIINSDDFGYSHEVNRGIIQAFNMGITSSTTLMCNLEGFEEACEIYHKYNLNGFVGMHFNLVEGRPITKEILSLRKVCDSDGNFIMPDHLKLMRFEKDEKRIIYNELDAQIQKVLSNGITLTHIDAHHHMHNIFSLTDLFFEISRKYNIRNIRIARNYGNDISYMKKIYKFFLNIKINHWSQIKIDLFGSFTDFPGLFEDDARYKNLNIEIMIHPIFKDNEFIIDPGVQLTHAMIKHLKINNIVSFEGKKYNMLWLYKGEIS